MVNKLLIIFKGNHYSIVKDAFKALFRGVLKWNGVENGWFGKDGYVKATAKMEAGAPVTFMVECNDELLDKFIGHDEKRNDKIMHIPGFCDTNKIEFQKIESFDSTPKAEPDTLRPPKVFQVKIDKTHTFLIEMSEKRGKFSDVFIDRWYQLLAADDIRLNTVLNNPQET